MDNLLVRCDEITQSYDEETKIIPTNFNEKKQTVKFKISIS